MKLRLVILAKPLLSVLSCVFLLCLGHSADARSGSQEAGEQELYDRESGQPKGESKAVRDEVKEKSTIQALQRRLQEQEQTIAVLSHQIEIMSSQLEDLRRIDEDTQGQKTLLPLSEGVP